MAIYVGISEGDSLDIWMAVWQGHMGDKRGTMHGTVDVVVTTQCMTTSAIGEIQKYSFGHSTCKCDMYWDSPDLYLKTCQDPYQAVYEKLPV